VKEVVRISTRHRHSVVAETRHRSLALQSANDTYPTNVTGTWNCILPEVDTSLEQLPIVGMLRETPQLRGRPRVARRWWSAAAFRWGGNPYVFAVSSGTPLLSDDTTAPAN
jgi:hypothetical protein